MPIADTNAPTRIRLTGLHVMKESTNASKITIQELKLKTSQLKEKVSEIIEEGNARRIIVKKDGRTLVEFPLAVGVGGAAAALLISAPLTALGALAALVAEVQVIIEREEPASTDPEEEGDVD
ncbi:MAG: DUF4342 domain-containing protein [Rhodothermales bacterium]